MKTNISLNNIILSIYFIFISFLRELNPLKKSADYQSCDPTKLDDWLRNMGPEFTQYAYQMIQNGADKRVIRWLTDGQLLNDCGITNGIHRMKILEAAKRKTKHIY